MTRLAYASYEGSLTELYSKLRSLIFRRTKIAMANDRKEKMEDRVLNCLTESTRSLCGVELHVSDYPDRRVGSRPPIQGGCDGIISGLNFEVAVQIAEVPIAPGAYTQDARVDELRAVVVPLLQQACPEQQVDVVIDAGTIGAAFHQRNPARTKQVAQSIVEHILRTPLASGLSRYKYASFSLDGGLRGVVNRKFSASPYAAVSCGLTGGQGFDASFKEVLQKKCLQFDLYRETHLLCVALWSADFMHLNHASVVSAFASCGVDHSQIDSIWFVGGRNVPEVYPLRAYDLDCRNDARYIEELYIWWPELERQGARPFNSIPQRFGQRPIAAAKKLLSD
jgi:hypothetical protein